MLEAEEGLELEEVTSYLRGFARYHRADWAVPISLLFLGIFLLFIFYWRERVAGTDVKAVVGYVLALLAMGGWGLVRVNLSRNLTRYFALTEKNLLRPAGPGEQGEAPQ